ncbi:MAG: DALR domain-containing protein, partial [Candidatus Omnitrophota bacterium]
LQAHYSSPIDFSEKKMAEAGQAYERMLNLKKKLDDKCAGLPAASGIDPSLPFKEQFAKYMDDDFNTPRGLSVLFDMITACNKILDDPDDGSKGEKLSAFRELMQDISYIFGFTYQPQRRADVPDDISDEEIKSLINKRKEYKAGRKFNEADEIRKSLEAKGVILEDTKGGTTWRRKL